MDRDSLMTRVSSGERIKYLFFWGHQKPDDGSVASTCFSQWYDAGFELDGIRYKTAEHYMMAGKARLFDDAEMLEAIVACDHPGEAKKLGRRVRGFDEMRWRDHRVAIVVAGNLAKFEQNPALGDFLLDTGDRVIVEASPRDRIWGIGMGAKNPDATEPGRWRGLNLLGFALMDVRDQLSARRR